MVNGVLFLGVHRAVFGHRKEGTAEVTKEGLELTRVKSAACLIIFIYLFTAICLSLGGNGYFTCIQNMKLVTNNFFHFCSVQ